ncbi:hypothetical protein Tco_1268868 [Tanacetum coccineum]
MNVVPLRSDTIRLVQNGCAFHELRSEDPNQYLKDFLKLMGSLDLNVENRERTRLHVFQISPRDQASNRLERLPVGSISTWWEINHAAGGKLYDKSVEDSWEIIENLVLYDHESWNGPRDFTKLVKAISLPQDVPKTSDRRLLELEE